MAPTGQEENIMVLPLTKLAKKEIEVFSLTTVLHIKLKKKICVFSFSFLSYIWS